MRRGRFAVSMLVLCGLLAAVPSFAAARSAYVTGSNSGAVPYAVPVDLSAQTPGGENSFPSGEGAPSDVAITPDGSTAYVPTDELFPIDVATNTAGSSVPVLSGAWGVAISPDGTRVYVTDPSSDNVWVVDTATNTVIAGPIAVGSFPRAIAVTPSGAFTYVVNAFDDSVSVINTATNTVVGVPILVGSNPSGIAVTPNGSFVYVVNSNSDDVSVISTATNTVVATIAGAGGNSIAITPDGTRAYTVDAGGTGTAIDTATNTVGAPFPVTAGNYLPDLAILPDGSTAYVTSDGNSTSGLVPLSLATNGEGTLFPVGKNPDAIAIVPNQPPHAAFTPSPESASPGETVAFDAAASTDSDGTVARYDWDFGDGATAPDGGSTPSHAYAKAGTYTVTLTETDNEGCSTEIIFTGQTAYCNGSSVARTTRTVTVAGSCPRIAGQAKTFRPKIVPGHVVPGVRVRLASNQPIFIKVKGKLIWSKGGAKHKTKLGRASGKLFHWRRIRFPLPRALRNALPIGTRVTLQLRIKAIPRRKRNVCGGRTITKTVHLRVKKVFPNRVQRGRLT